MCCRDFSDMLDGRVGGAQDLPGEYYQEAASGNSIKSESKTPYSVILRYSLIEADLEC